MAITRWPAAVSSLVSRPLPQPSSRTRPSRDRTGSSSARIPGAHAWAWKPSRGGEQVPGRGGNKSRQTAPPEKCPACSALCQPTSDTVVYGASVAVRSCPEVIAGQWNSAITSIVPGPAPGHSRPQDLTQASTRLPSPAGARFESPAGLLLVNEALTHVIGQWRHSLAGRSAAARVMISRAKRERISPRSAFTMSTRRPVTANAISAATCALVSTSAGDRV